MPITTRSSLRWVSYKKKSTAEMHGISTINSSRRWMRCVVLRRIRRSRYCPVVKRDGSPYVSCFYSNPICFCWMSPPTTLMLRAFSGSNNTLKNTRGPLSPSPTIGTSWTMLPSGFWNWTEDVPIHMKAITPLTWKQRPLGSRLKVKKMSSCRNG